MVSLRYSYYLILLVGLSAISTVNVIGYLNNVYADNSNMSENMSANGNMSASENVNMTENMNMTNNQNLTDTSMENMTTANENMTMNENMTTANENMTMNENMTSPTVENVKIDTSNATISNVITRNYGTNDVYSLVFVKYNGDLHINHVVVLQTNSGVQITKAWIAPKWDSQMSADTLTFHSDKTKIIKGKTLVIQVITDYTPAFKLSSVESHSGM